MFQEWTSPRMPKFRVWPKKFLVWPDWKLWRRFVSKIKETHCCYFDSELPDLSESEVFDSTKQLNIYEAYDHPSKCRLKFSCKSCSIAFDSKDDFLCHIKYDCLHVEINCPDCHKKFLRSKFKLSSHSCFSDFDKIMLKVF